MNELLIGGALANVDEPSEACYRRLVAMRARVVGTLWTDGTRHRRGVYERLDELLDEPEYVVRVGPSQQLTAEQWLEDARAAKAELPPVAIAERRVRFRVLNEVNLDAEGGWSAERYVAFLRAIREAWLLIPPNPIGSVQLIPLVASPLSLGREGWGAWLARFIELGGLSLVERIAVNAYAHLVDDAIEAYRGLGKLLDVTEINTLELAGLQRATWIVDRARDWAASGASTLQAFIVDGADPTNQWDDRYILTDEEAAEIGRLAGGVIAAEPATDIPEVFQEGPMPQNPPRADLEPYLRQKALEHGYDPNAAARQITQESGWRHWDEETGQLLTSPAGARGITQVMERFFPKADLSTPFTAIDFSMALMGSYVAKFKGDVARALMEYNGGYGAVQAFDRGRLASYADGETWRYVEIILGAVPAPHPAVPQIEDGVWSPTLAELGFDQSAIESACGPIAVAACAAALGLDVALEDVMNRAPDFGWTPAGGMNGADNLPPLALAFGVRLRDVPAAALRELLSPEAPGVISTGLHYYVATRPSRIDDDLYVGPTGQARRGGDVWMSLAGISALDAQYGGINGIWIAERAAVVEVPAEPEVDDITVALDGIWHETMGLAAIAHADRAVAIQEHVKRLKRALGREAA